MKKNFPVCVNELGETSAAWRWGLEATGGRWHVVSFRLCAIPRPRCTVVRFQLLTGIRHVTRHQITSLLPELLFHFPFFFF